MYIMIGQVILLGIILLILGISIGQLIGQWLMKPIINSYKRAIEGYKETLNREREIREEVVDEYKKLIDMLMNSYK